MLSTSKIGPSYGNASKFASGTSSRNFSSCPEPIKSCSLSSSPSGSSTSDDSEIGNEESLDSQQKKYSFMSPKHHSDEQREDGLDADEYQINIYFSSIDIDLEKAENRHNAHCLEDDRKQLDIQSSWLNVDMPNEKFAYTCAIELNDPWQGLLHSFLRHFDEWLEQGDFEVILNKLKPIRPQLNKIQDSPNYQTTREAITDLLEIIDYLKPNEANEIKSALYEAQTKIHEIVTKNIKNSNHIEKGYNFKNKLQAYFGTKNKRNIEQEMVVCVSNQLYGQVEEFTYERPVRIITTVFFVNIEQ